MFANMLRHAFLYMLLLSVMLLSCRPATQKVSEQRPQAERPADKWTTDSFRYEAANGYGSCEACIDYPLSGPPKAVGSIRDFIKSLLFEHRTQNIPTLPGDMVKSYCEERLSHFDKVLNQMELGQVSRDVAPEEGIEIRQIGLSDKWCTYEVYRYSYLTGGAHGEYTQYGVTFRLSDGHRLTANDLLCTVDDNLYSLIKKGMREYFEVDTDDELQDICNVDLSLRPMPSHAPFLTPQGVRFHYSIYDVCPFEWGDPSFTIPYDEIKPYLTGTALQLISK